MFFLGLISVLQAAFLPGLLLLKLLRVTDGLLKTLIFSFALSLILNHLIVFALVAAGLYCPVVMYGLLVFELLGIGCVLWRDRRRPSVTAQEGDWQRVEALVGDIGRHVPYARLALIVAAFLAVGTIAASAGTCWREMGTIFTQWDPVVTWNRWAMAWSENRLPRMTFLYPQLVPSTWSVTYVFMGDSQIQFFAKWLMGLFPLGILLVQADLALRTRRAAYLMAVPLTGWAMWRLVPVAVASGHADVPVAFMGFVAYYALLVSREQPTPARIWKHVWIGAVVAGGALLTKQTGLVVVLTYPLLVYLFLVRSSTGRPAPKKCRWAVWSAAWILILILPWYVYKGVQIYLGLDASEIWFVISNAEQTHAGRSLLERVTFAVASLRHCLPAPVLMGVIPVALLAALCDRTWRWLVLLVVVPLLAVWWVGFSYDRRNLAMAIPLAATAAAVGLERLATVLWATKASRRLAMAAGFGVFLAVVWIYAERFRFEVMLEQQIASQRSICLPGLNRFLYEYHRWPGFRGKILGNNGYLYALPEIREIYRYDPLQNAASLEARIAEGDIRYILATDCAHLEEYFHKCISAGRLKLICSLHDHELFEIVVAEQ